MPSDVLSKPDSILGNAGRGQRESTSTGVGLGLAIAQKRLEAAKRPRDRFARRQSEAREGPKNASMLAF